MTLVINYWERKLYFLSVLSQCFFFLYFCRCFIIYGRTVSFHQSTVVAANSRTRDRDLVREYSQIHLCVSSTIKKNISMRRHKTETSSFKLCLYCWGYQTAEVHTVWFTHDNINDRFSARGMKNNRKAQRRRENRITLVFWRL